MIDLITRLDAEPRRPSIGPGRANLAVKSRIAALALKDICPAVTANDGGDSLRACKAGLFLWHDLHDESHAISQDLNTIEGSYWHAILHRREPDAFNANYWFRRVGRHPIGPNLLAEAKVLIGEASDPSQHLKRLAASSTWDHGLFVEVCEAARDTGSVSERVAEQIQAVEMGLLYEYCFALAAGSPS